MAAAYNVNVRCEDCTFADAYGGSMSHAIAAHKLGFDLTIIEKDPVYYELAKKRLIDFQKQQVLF